MPSSINGTGTVYYGQAAPRPDGSYVVTEWVAFFGIPLVPLGSKRVRVLAVDRKWWSNRSTVNYSTQDVPLHMPHLLKGYAVTAGVAALLAVVDYVHF